MSAKSLQSCLTLCDPVDQSTPGFSVHGILQGRILDWVAIPSSRGSFQPRDQTQVSALQVDSLLSQTPGKPSFFIWTGIKKKGELHLVTDIKLCLIIAKWTPISLILSSMTTSVPGFSWYIKVNRILPTFGITILNFKTSSRNEY